MQEIKCPRCGALYFPPADVRVCPHCGAGPPTFLTRLRAQAHRIGWLSLWIFLIVWSLEPPAWAWAAWGFVAMLAACGWAWSVVSQKLHRGAYEPLNTIDIYPRVAQTERAPVVPRPLPTPPEWKSLISMARPREVYWPFRTKLNLAFEAMATVFIAALPVVQIHRHGLAFVNRHLLRPMDLLVFIPIAVGIYLLPRRIQQELAARALLRDGEVTTGFVTDWGSAEEPYQASYQFWTGTGERFEQRGIFANDYDSAQRNGRVPVFYMPEDPTKSVALCCCNLRVRLPEESLERSAMKDLARD